MSATLRSASRHRSVSVWAGSTTLTAMCQGRSSSRSASAAASSANLDALYAPIIGAESLPFTLEMKTIRPCDSRSSGSTACVTASWPTTLTSSCRRISAGVNPSSGPLTAIPALLTTASRRPGSASGSAATCASSVTSSVTALTRGSADNASASAALRTPPMTSQPAAAR